ncbi:MAG: alpha/beta hydrolase [Proteobacteria bacterium]|nr:alpha/beta hydrolase [Pseudomonadota bacterium]
MTLQTITKQTGNNPKLVIIWLHGLGADGNDFTSIVPEFSIVDLPIKFVFPHAPKIAVTINGGMTMRAWYDILAMDIDRHIDKNGIKTSVKLIHELIDQQIALGFTHNQIVLAGFSQGSAMSIQVSTQYQHKLAGLIALSGYLPIPEEIATNSNNININIPIFMGHGVQDPVVPYDLGKSSRDKLIKAGYTVDWHEYPMQHGVSVEEIRDIRLWIEKNLKP